MRCRKCSYQLWNMVPGACPECGQSWSFTAYRFRPGKTQFLCPHCQHSYAGSDSQGLPEPHEFACVECGNAVTLAGMRALPAPGSDGFDAMDDDFPWVERRRIGRFRAYFKSFWQAIIAPRGLGVSLPQRPRIMDALTFAATTAIWACWLCVGPILLFVGVGLGLGGMGTGGVLVGLAGVSGVLVVPPLVVLLLAAMWSLATHALLKLLGGANRGIGVTMATTGYSMSGFGVCCVPCLCIYFAPVGVLIMANSLVFALSSAHGIKLWKSAVAVLVPLAIVFAIAIGGVIFAINAPSSLPGGTTVLSPVPASVTLDPNALPGVAAEAPEEEEPADDEFPAQGEPDSKEPKP